MTAKTNRPAANGTASNNAHMHATAYQAGLPVVSARVIPATEGRRLDVAVVQRCPWCLGQHLHRAAIIDGTTRRAACGPRRAYVLAVTR